MKSRLKEVELYLCNEFLPYLESQSKKIVFEIA